MVADIGVMAIDTGTAAVTVTFAVPLTPSHVAVIVAVTGRVVAGGAALVTSPNPTDVSVASDVVHAALPVRSAVVPSENVPVAFSCCDCPFATELTAGVTETAVSETPVALMVRVVLAETDPAVTVIVVEPAPIIVTAPLVKLIAATAGLLDVQFGEERATGGGGLGTAGGGGGLYETIPTPVKFGAGPACKIVGLEGEITMETTTGLFTFAVALPVTPAQAAVIAEEPAAISPLSAATSPVELTVASAGEPDVQTAVAVRSCVVPSE